LNRSQYLVPRLTPEQLREAIEAPAALTGVEFEPALVQRLLVETSTAPDELPRLQHLLKRLWEQRIDGNIKLSQYHLPKIMGFKQALDLHAEEIYDPLTEEQKGIAQRVFQRLTTWGEASRDARRPTPPSELAAVSGASVEDVAEVVRRFLQADFLAEIPPVGMSEPFLDITHESLIRHWKRLRRWAQEEARYKKILRALAHTKQPLWNEVAVREAIEWRDNVRPSEAWAARYAPGRLGAALGMLQRLEMELTVVETRRQQALESRRQESVARQLAAESISLLSVSPNSYIPAALLAVESMRRRPLVENHSALRQSTLLMTRQVWRLDHKSPVKAVAFSPDCKWVATGAGDTRVIDAISGRETTRGPYQGVVCAVAFSSDGNSLATGSDDNTARVIEAATGKEMSRLDHQGPVKSVAFSPDHKWVATGSWDKTVRIMEAATGEEVSRLDHQGRVSSVVFSANGKWVATASWDNTARVIEAATG
jgi:hypothetical protein